MKITSFILFTKVVISQNFLLLYIFIELKVKKKTNKQYLTQSWENRQVQQYLLLIFKISTNQSYRDINFPRLVKQKNLFKINTLTKKKVIKTCGLYGFTLFLVVCNIDMNF